MPEVNMETRVIKVSKGLRGGLLLEIRRAKKIGGGC